MATLELWKRTNRASLREGGGPPMAVEGACATSLCLQTLLSRVLLQSPIRRQLPPGGSLSYGAACESVAIQTDRQIKI